MKKELHTPRDYINFFGAKELAEELEVSRAAVGMAATQESLRSSWYWKIKELCRKKRIKCPHHLFNFKGKDLKYDT